MKTKIVYGKWTFEAGDIFGGHYGQATSLSISVLSLDTFRATVLCDDPTIQDIMSDAPLEYYEDDVKRAVYYVDAITRIGPQKYTLSALSPLSRLAQKTHYGGIYTGQAVEEVIGGICGEIPYIIKSNLLGTKIYNWLPIANARSNLQQVLLILGANLWTDHDGVLRISALWDGLASVVDDSRVYAAGASARRDQPVTHVTVLDHAYTPGAERRELFSGTATQGQRIPFDGPMSDLETEGLTILESGANYAVVAAGSGKVTGCPYIHTTLEVTRQVATAAVKNEVRIEGATLVSLVNSTAVANRLVSYYACRETIQVDAVLRQEHPGEVVQIIHPYDRTMTYACISAAEVELSATLKGSLTALVGFEPEQSGDSQYFDDRVVLTGEGDWIPPEGAEEVTAVLIGKGQPGTAGTDGTAGTTSSLWVSSADVEKGGTWSTPGKPGGSGGEKGLGGEGGKILRLNLSLDTQAPIHYNTTGLEAIFGAHSSAEGSQVETGYFDPVTEETFAAKGPDGEDGADGGAGGNASLNNPQPGAPGGSVNSFPGGEGGQPGSSPPPAENAFKRYLRTGGGGGGGAAEGNAGSDASNIHGANGADALQPQENVVIGAGGHGGNGGGGGGGAGGIYFQCEPISYHPGLTYSARAGEPGQGTDGTQGGPAGIILYFRRKKEINAGAFVTKKKNFFVDKSGRLFIV